MCVCVCVRARARVCVCVLGGDFLCAYVEMDNKREIVGVSCMMEGEGLFAKISRAYVREVGWETFFIHVHMKS
jgi:hypothetical protein